MKDKSILIKGCNWHIFCNGVWDGAFENIEDAVEIIRLLPLYNDKILTTFYNLFEPITLIDLS